MLRHKSVVYVNKAEDVPTVEHWAIITSTSVYTPASGEWAPGHGYPAGSDNYIKYEAYTDKAEFEEEVKHKSEETYRRPFRVLHVLPLSVSTSVTVK